MMADFDLGILAEPLQPPLSRRCDKCRRLFALKLVKALLSEGADRL